VPEAGVRPVARRVATPADAGPSHVLVFAGAALLAAIAYLVNLRGAVDFDLDEVMYTIAGQNVADHGSVSWGSQPTAVHPPLHFLLLGLWAAVTGTAHAPVLDALMAGRYLGAGVSIVNVVMVGLLCRLYCRDARLIGATMLLAIVDSFLLRFGRTALIEPTAVLAGLLVVYAALRLRRAGSPLSIGVVGVTSGLALLVKEPLLFTILVPGLAAVLERDWAYLRRSAAALLVALLVWAVFPLWAVLGGSGAWWLSEHTTSLDRLAGFLQVSGMNRPGVSATGVFGGTVATYLSGYLILAVGAAGLLKLTWTAGLFHQRRADPKPASLIAFAVLSYGFLGYCVLLGQANEQLTAYSAVPAVLVSVLAWGRPMPRRAVAVCAFTASVGLVAWIANVALAHDDATVRMGRYLTTHDACAPVNATGDAMRWVPVLPRNHVQAIPDGPTALNSGVHLFLLSTKDSAMRYGISSPELDAWVRAHGRPAYQLASRRYDTVELWSVAGPARAAAEPCGNAGPAFAANASSARFVNLLLAAIVLVCAGMYGSHRRGRR
jgi:hypothetical protein